MDAVKRHRLTRDVVLARAVALADTSGLAGLSMRTLAQELGVVPMALYKHVAGKEKLAYGVEDAILQMRVIDALFRSEKSGNWEKP